MRRIKRREATFVGSDGVVELFLRAADRQPSSLAVRTVSESVTYRALEGLAGGVARRLEGTRDGAALLLATTGIDLAAGALGVLASGRALVPVDPRSPPDRIAELAQTADASSVVTSDLELVGAVGLASDVSVVATRGSAPAPLEPRPVDEGSVAMIGFTSGTTGGPPRLVGETHKQIITQANQHALGDPDAHERVGTLLGATRSVVRRVLFPLIDGGIVSCLDARTADPIDLVRTFADHDVTYLMVISTYLRRMLGAVDVGPALPSLRVLVSNGESIEWSDVAAIRERLSRSCQVRHGYGLSEAGRVARRLIEPDEPIGQGTVPVGWPYPWADISIETETGEPVPDGQVGEFVLTSRMIRPGVDADELPDGRRRYRTSDLGYRMPDGQLVIVGRRDRMVKIGGIRIEPERVEAILRQVDGIREVVVLRTHGDDATAGLVAHIAGDPGDHTVERTLTAHATQRLHEAAVPTQFVWHPQGLPTLPSGKINIVALELNGAGRDSAAVQVPSDPSTGPE